MPSRHRNVVVDPGAPARIAALRARFHLTRAELAEKSGISIRTLQDLETGRRRRIQEKTLILLAEALEVEPWEILEGYPAPTAVVSGPAPAGPQAMGRRPAGPETPPPPTTASLPPQHDGTSVGPASHPGAWRQPVLISTGVSVVLLVLLGLGLRSWCRRHATWSLDAQHHLVVRAALFGDILWKADAIITCRTSPWSATRFLVGEDITSPGGGRLLYLEKATGDTIWTAYPDTAAVSRAFGAATVHAAGFGCNHIQPADVDGDGEPELAVGFTHGLYYPYVQCLVDRHGTVHAQYANYGHIYETLVADLDNDGKDEVLLTGLNNPLGATVILLDDTCWRGASTDSLATPSSLEPDSARVRVIFPTYPEPYRSLMEGRLLAFNPCAVPQPGGGYRIIVCVGSERHHHWDMTITLDSDLQILSCVVNDSFRDIINSEWPDSLAHAGGPLNDAWRERWLASVLRFTAGHWPPHQGGAARPSVSAMSEKK